MTARAQTTNSIQISKQTAIHLLNRITFGGRPTDVAALTGPRTNYLAYLNDQLNPDLGNDNPVLPEVLGQLTIPVAQGDPTSLQHLQAAMLARAMESHWQLNEVMTRFWEQHFNTNAITVRNRVSALFDLSAPDNLHVALWLEWQDHEFYRQNALGKFRDLLERTTLSPPMMMYLNLVDSKGCAKPNENYAREFLELYTMGRVRESNASENYTQADVVEVAKCFTGWRLADAPPISAFFDSGEHCAEVKTIFRFKPHGIIVLNTGASELYTLVNHVAGADSTKEFICRKLMRFFLDDDADDENPALLASMMSKWGAEGDIKEALRVLLSSSVFAIRQDYRWSRARTPFETVAWLPRAWGASLIQYGGTSASYQKLLVPWQQMLDLGQDPLVFPTPDGYPIASIEQPGSSAAIESYRYAQQIFTQILVSPTEPFQLFPTFDLPTMAIAEVADPQNADQVARWMLGRLYGSAWSTDDLSEVISGLGTLDSSNLLAYAQQLATGAVIASSFNKAQLK